MSRQDHSLVRASSLYRSVSFVRQSQMPGAAASSHRLQSLRHSEDLVLLSGVRFKVSSGTAEV